MGLIQKIFGSSKSTNTKEIEFIVAGVEYDTNKRSRQEILRTAVTHHAKLNGITPYVGLLDAEFNEGSSILEYGNLLTTHLRLD